MEFDDFGERECGGPWFGVYVAANRENRRDGFELVEDSGIADIAGVDDEV